jgi:FkbM family methyltransferase
MKSKSPGGGGKNYLGSESRNEEYFKNFTYPKLINSFLDPGSIRIIDIGARFGESTNWFASHFDISYAYLIEPNPMIEITVNSSVKEFKIYKCALSNVNGTQIFHVHKNEGMSSLERINLESKDSISYSMNNEVSKIEVQVKTLDSLSIESPTLVKIDVQSSETKVIEGGQKTLSDARIILVEVSLYDLYINTTTIGRVESLLPNHTLYSIPFISYNPKNLRTDWVELFFVKSSLLVR